MPPKVSQGDRLCLSLCLLKMPQKYLLKTVLILIFSSHFLAGQSTNKDLKAIWENANLADSIRFKALTEYFQLNNQAQPDSTLLVLDFYHRLAIAKKAKEELFHVANFRGNIYRLKGESAQAMRYYKEADSLVDGLDKPELKAIVLGNLGNVHIQNKNYQLATQHFSKSLKIHQEIHNLAGESHMLTSLGNVFVIIENFDAALEYYQKALAISEHFEIVDRRKAVIYLNMGWANYNKSKLKEAQANYEAALEILDRTKDKFFAINGSRALASIHLKLGDYEQATLYAEKNRALCKELNSDVLHSDFIFARLDFEKNLLAEATQKAEALIPQINGNTGLELKVQIFELLYKCYKQGNNSIKALEMLERFDKCKDSIQLERNNFGVVREAVKNDFDLKLYETKLENEKARSELELKQLKITFSIIVLAIFSLGGITFYFRRSKRKDKERRKELLEEIERLKNFSSANAIGAPQAFELDKTLIEISIGQKLNETDWKILNILLNEPAITNREIAEKAFLSVDGIGSALRRMYLYFDIKDSKYKKTELIREVIKISTNSPK